MKLLKAAVGIFTLLALLIALAVLLPLLVTAWRDSAKPLPEAPASRFSDGSRKDAAPVELVEAAADTPTALKQLQALMRRAKQERRPLALAGARHSQGGHSYAPGALVADLRPMRGLAFDPSTGLLEAAGGALWMDVVPFLDAHGRSVAVMQSDANFSVGGTLSVNAHGWQSGKPPIASTVVSMQVLTPDGVLRECCREKESRLFHHVLGGYGLFGVIISAKLRTVPNAVYQAQIFECGIADYAQLLKTEALDLQAPMAFGRLDVSLKGALDRARLAVFREVRAEPAKLGPPSSGPMVHVKRWVFLNSVENDAGKRLRWLLEGWFVKNQARSKVTRNALQRSDASFYLNRDPGRSDILHEYFLPVDQVPAFVAALDKARRAHGLDLLNVTLRDVQTDTDTVLRYAPGPRLALVLFFSQRHGEAAEAAMTAGTRELIDAALALGGSYYLPYRPHATREQFLRAYPQAPSFFAAKRAMDPTDLLQNSFYQRYGR